MFTQIELASFRDWGDDQGRGEDQLQTDRHALARVFLAKAILDLKTTRAWVD